MTSRFNTWIASSAICLLALTWSCGAMWHDARLPVKDLLDLEFMNDKLGTTALDLSREGQCPGTRPLKLMNVTQDTEQYIVLRSVGHKHYVIPQAFTEVIKGHVEAKLIESQLKIDATAGGVIHLSFEEAQVEGSMVPEATVRLRFEIPKLNYSQVYTGIEGSASGYHALAYGIHLAIDKFIKDPVFQKYVTCR